MGVGRSPSLTHIMDERHLSEETDWVLQSKNGFTGKRNGF